ncbi:MAG: class I SAM-dependent methyltransferase [bacterium]
MVKQLHERRMEAVESAILSERDFRQYQDNLDITAEELNKWDKIVDLGAGTRQEFAREVSAGGFDAEVISVDPRLLLSEEEDLAGMLEEEAEARILGRNEPFGEVVGALAQDLPFEDESIDAVLAHFSVPMYLESKSEINEALDEILRVLMPGGEARIYPVSSTKNQQEVLEWLADHEDEIEVDSEIKEENLKVGEVKYLIKIKKRGAKAALVA